jgi:carbon monoxide dehydrogenase subunit G
MPEGKSSFVVKAPLGKTWELFRSMENWGLCIPNCREVKKISENQCEGTIEARVLRTSREIKGRVQMIEVNPPTHVKYRGEGELKEGFARFKVTFEATLNLQPVTDSQTRVDFAGSVLSSGLGGTIINKIASSQTENMINRFVQNIRDKLER